MKPKATKLAGHKEHRTHIFQTIAVLQFSTNTKRIPVGLPMLSK